ncbi:MAG: GAF domain-containing protein [Clostridia bacterium]|nr:GAF domain-containing protein [Clostridia bacterium]
MNSEMESIWATMKGPFYERTIGQLQQGIREADCLDTALAAALNRVATAAHAETGTFWFYNKCGDGLIRAKAVYGGGDLRDIALRPGEGVAGQVVASGRSAIVQDCQSDPRWAGKVDAATGFRTRSMVCVPLSWKGQAFGCIQIINKTDGTEFDETDLVFVEKLAEYAARLFQERHLLDGYENGVAAVASVAETPDPTFSSILSAEEFSGVAEKLRGSILFKSLSETEQKHVLRHVREIWTIIRKSDSAPGKPGPWRSGR